MKAYTVFFTILFCVVSLGGSTVFAGEGAPNFQSETASIPQVPGVSYEQKHEAPASSVDTQMLESLGITLGITCTKSGDQYTFQFDPNGHYKVQKLITAEATTKDVSGDVTRNGLNIAKQAGDQMQVQSINGDENKFQIMVLNGEGITMYNVEKREKNLFFDETAVAKLAEFGINVVDQPNKNRVSLFFSNPSQFNLKVNNKQKSVKHRIGLKSNGRVENVVFSNDGSFSFQFTTQKDTLLNFNFQRNTKFAQKQRKRNNDGLSAKERWRKYRKEIAHM